MSKLTERVNVVNVEQLGLLKIQNKLFHCVTLMPLFGSSQVPRGLFSATWTSNPKFSDTWQRVRIPRVSSVSSEFFLPPHDDLKYVECYDDTIRSY